MKNLCVLLTLIVLFVSSCQKEPSKTAPDEGIDFRDLNLSEDILNIKEMLVGLESFRQYALFLGQSMMYSPEYIEANVNTLRQEHELLQINLESDLHERGIVSIDDLNIEAVRLAGTEVIGAAIEIETTNDLCCRDAAQRRQVCRDLAVRGFVDVAMGIGVVAIIGTIIIVATEGAGTLAAEVVIGKLIQFAGGAAVWDYVRLYANLQACNYTYEAEIQSCPCQCDWSNYPC